MTECFAHGYALLIGVGRSAYPDWSLPVTVKDVTALQAILENPAFCGYSAANIRVLTDDRATRQAILEGLDWLKQQATTDPDATIVVYYSGHGWLDQAQDRYYLVQHDIKPFNLAGSALAAEEFTAALQQISAERLLVVIDSCHAEGMATAKVGVPELELPTNFVAVAPSKGLFDPLSQQKGRAVFTSCAGTQKSWIRKDQQLSIFTHHLIEALQGAANHPGETTVKVSHMMNHLGKTVEASAMTEYQAAQAPQFDFKTEDFAIALLQGGKGLPTGGWEAVKQQASVPHISVQASGERSVAIGGGVSGGSIMTGDRNSVNSNNVSQYSNTNVHIHNASNFSIGNADYFNLARNEVVNPSTHAKFESRLSQDLDNLRSIIKRILEAENPRNADIQAIEDANQYKLFLHPSIPRENEMQVENNTIYIYGESAQKINSLLTKSLHSEQTKANIPINDLARSIRRQYFEGIPNNYKEFQLLLGGRKVEVEHLYVDVYILDELSRDIFVSPKDLWDLLLKNQRLGTYFDESNDRLGLGSRKERRLGLKVAEEEKFSKLMILGKPGSGKTTFLRQLLVSCCKENFLPDYVPVLIELRSISLKTFNLYQEISEQLSNNEPEQIERLLKAGRFLILLDGLDETTEQLQKDIQADISRFLRKYSKNRLIMTCRLQTGAAKNFSSYLRYVEVADFNEEQRDQFITNWFSTFRKTRKSIASMSEKELLKGLQQNEPISELAKTPILLNLICAFAESKNGVLPSKRAELYNYGLELLLTTWDRDRGVAHYSKSEIYQKLDPLERQQLLAYISAYKFKETENYILFHEPNLQETIKDFFKEYTGYYISMDEAGEILRTISEQHGLLIERTRKIWSFSHLTFQEYLTADWFCTKQDWDALAFHWMEAKWELVFQLALEKSEAADPLFRAIKRRVDGLLAQDNKLQQFLGWIEEETRLEQDRNFRKFLGWIYKKLGLVHSRCNIISVRAYFSAIALLSILKNFQKDELSQKHGSGAGKGSSSVLNLSKLVHSFQSRLSIRKASTLEQQVHTPMRMDTSYHSLVLARTFALEPNFIRSLAIKRSVFELAVVNILICTLCIAVLFLSGVLHFSLIIIILILIDILFLIIKFRKKNRNRWQYVQSLLQEPPSTSNGSLDAFHLWWDEHSDAWMNSLVKHWKVGRDHENRGYTWIFNDSQRKLLTQYYAANKLLIDCLASNYDVSPEVRREIEDTLLLPIAKTKKRTPKN